MEQGMITHDDLHRKEVTWCRFPCIPAEYASVMDRHARVRGTELFPLQVREICANLDDVIPRPLVYVGIVLPQVVEDVKGKRTVPCANLVDDEVLVREVLQQVLRH